MNLGEEKKKEGQNGPDNGMMEKFLETRSVLISGEINKESAERIIRSLLMLEAAGDGPIKVFIDSPGGDADTGYAVFDMIRFIKPDVYTIGMGLVASAGALILLAGDKDKRLAFPNSHYLIHQPLSGIRGVATEIEIHARELDKMKKRINTLISKETGKALAEVEKDTDRDYWMDAEEAKTYGLVSKVLTGRGDLKI